MSDEKKHSERRKYAILPKETIKVFAEAAGHPDISDDIASLLAEDVAYRLREATQVRIADPDLREMLDPQPRSLGPNSITRKQFTGDLLPIWFSGLEGIVN